MKKCRHRRVKECTQDQHDSEELSQDLDTGSVVLEPALLPLRREKEVQQVKD